MILQRIALRDFRRFASFAATFAPGFNVVVGNNEEGKSTLREAITLALFQDAKTSDRKVLSLQRWGAAEQFAIELAFAADGKEYVLTKDFQTKTARLEEVGSGERLQDAKVIEAHIKRLLGLGSRALFESTARVSQRDIVRLQAGHEIADSLQRLVTGGEEDVQASRVLEEIDKALGALKTAARSNPGPLAVLPERIVTNDAALAGKRGSLARVEAARRELAATAAALATAREDLAQNEAAARDCGERLRLEEELAKALQEERALEGTLGQAQRLSQIVARDERELTGYGAVLAVPAAQAVEVAALARQAAVVDGPAEAAAQARPAWLVAGALLAVAGLVGGMAYPPLFALLLAGKALLVWVWLRDRQAVALARARAEERRREAEAAARRLGDILASHDCLSPADFHARRQAGEELRQRIGENRARLEGLLAEREVADLEEQRRAATRKVRELRERLDDPAMRLARLDQLAYLRLLQDGKDLRRQVESLQSEIADLRVAVLANQVGVDEVHALAEEGQELRERLAAAQERQQVLALSRQVLAEARAASMVAAKDVLAEELGRMVAEITRGRYSQVIVDPTKLSMQLLAPDRDAPVDVVLEGELSTGTVEQVYLAARLALARLLAGDRRPPFILDDPFVTFDAPRTVAVLALCRRLAATHQILLFTRDEGYCTAADNVVRLPALAG